ncbi:DUF5343 domain-containing protein [Roseiarcus sp.]|uniref:DUF5343 domain-containing protein n=1 Tax=Roseiarcus sp. TaxID=1969460 RepID=UPI003C70DB2B
MPGGGSEQARSTRTPPYTSYRTFKTFIEDLREHGVPSRIDRSVLTRFSGVVGTQLMHALKFLGLIEDHGIPTQRLRELVDAHGAGHWPETLLELLRQEYAPMFAIDLETATPSHFNGAFRKAFPAAEAVVQKCVTFFLYAVGDAGVKISGRVLKGRKPRSLTPRRKHAPAPAPAKEPEAGPSRPQADTPRLEDKKPSEILLGRLDPNEMDDEQQAAVWTLLKYFKARGL